MSDKESENQTTAGEGKRKRTSEDEGEKATGEENPVENVMKSPRVGAPPKKKRSRKPPQNSTDATPTNRVDSSQQPKRSPSTGPPPSAFNMDDIRRSRKENAMHILNETLPAVVRRLRELHRRSMAATDGRRGFDADQKEATFVDGPWTSAKKRTLVSQMERLVSDATDLMQQHVELLKKGNEKSFERKKASNFKRLQKLMVESDKVAEDHRQVQQANRQDEQLDQKSLLEEARLILRHPVFLALLPDVNDLDMEGLLTELDVVDSPSNADTPLGDTAELIELVGAEMRKIVDCSTDLKQWVSLSAPPLDVDTEQDYRIRDTVRLLIDGLVKNCKDNSNCLEEHIVMKAGLVIHVMEEPLSLDRMRALYTFNDIEAVTWRTLADFHVFECERLMDFVHKHVHVLDPSRPRVNTTSHMFG